jgi:hypothetical protein
MTSKFRYIFLDIDGVLSSARTKKELGGKPVGFTPTQRPYFDWPAVEMLRDICERAGATCVLSSSWRHDYTCARASKYLGLPFSGSTPSLSGGRGAEIAAWLSERGHESEYVIVDDIVRDLLPEQFNFTIQVDELIGFSQADAVKVLKLFKRRPKLSSC